MTLAYPTRTTAKPTNTALLLFAVVALASTTPLTRASAQVLPRFNAHDIDTMTVKMPGERISYGLDSLQFGVLRMPSGTKGPFPVAIVVHGGCYLSSYASLTNTSPLADALTAGGIATWNVEYRRYDNPGGGWPNTFDDVAKAADYLRTIKASHNIDLTRVITIGHSAGGQLALWLASRSTRPTAASPHPIHIDGVVALGPIVDMREYQKRQLLTCGNPGIEAVLGGMPDSVPERLHAVSPIDLLPLRVPAVLIAGSDDGIAPVAVLENYARHARSAGDSVEIVTPPGESHFDAIAPMRGGGKAAISAALRLTAKPIGPRKKP
jgi:acetyl esterase/lipase